MPKISVGEAFTVAIIPGIEKFYASEGYVTIFCRFFCLTVPKNLVGESFSISLISSIEKFNASKGYVTIFCRYFCLTVPKKLVGEHFCAVFQKISGTEKVWIREGGINIFRRKTFVSQCRKIP